MLTTRGFFLMLSKWMTGASWSLLDGFIEIEAGHDLLDGLGVLGTPSGGDVGAVAFLIEGREELGREFLLGPVLTGQHFAEKVFVNFR
jgi:hypothetical protein